MFPLILEPLWTTLLTVTFFSESHHSSSEICLRSRVKHLSTQPDKKTASIRMTKLRGFAPLIIFVLIAALLETLVVLYAISLGLKDTGLLQWSFSFPGASSSTTLAISPLFHLVPLCVMVTLACGWVYLSKRLTIKRQEIRKGKIELSTRQKVEKKGILSRMRLAGKNFSKSVKTRFSGASRTAQRMHLGRPTVRSAIFVLLIFGALILMFSLFAYPDLVYHGVSNLYRANTGLSNFVASTSSWARGAAEALGPIGWLTSSINSGLLSAAPGFRDLAVGLGGAISPLASLDDAGKYLAFQNIATLISVLLILLYGERVGKGYRYKK
jgi:hypothetical protein